MLEGEVIRSCFELLHGSRFSLGPNKQMDNTLNKFIVISKVHTTLDFMLKSTKSNQTLR